MRTLTTLAIVLALASCGGREAKKADTPVRVEREYLEMITKYENTYNADSQLVKVVERDHPVVFGLESPPDKTRTYEFLYRRLSDGATEQRKYRVWEDGERELQQTLVTSPRRWEETTDSTNYERKSFDAAGLLTMEERRYKMDYSDYDMVNDVYHKSEYEYDAQGREIKRTALGITNGDKTSYEHVTAYLGDTDEIVSETSRDLLSGSVSTAEYRREFSGDTLVRKRYSGDNVLEAVEKSLPAAGYSSVTHCGDGTNDGTGKWIEEIFTDSLRRVEVLRESIEGFPGVDSTYYENGRKTRWYMDRKDSRIIYDYQYDSRGNLTSERAQMWSYDTESAPLD